MAERNWVLQIIIVFLLLIGSYGSACAAGPQNIAILPVINHAEVRDLRVLSCIEQALQSKFHTPLPSLVPIYTLIPADEVIAAASKVYHGEPGNFTPDAESLRRLAAGINADMVIAAKVNEFRHDRFVDFEGDQKARSYVAITVFYYERESGKLFIVHDDREYLGDELPFGDPLYLTNELMNSLLAKIPIRPFAVYR